MLFLCFRTDRNRLHKGLSCLWVFFFTSPLFRRLVNDNKILSDIRAKSHSFVTVKVVIMNEACYINE